MKLCRLFVLGVLTLNICAASGAEHDSKRMLLDRTFAGDAVAGRYPSMSYRSEQWYESTFWSGPDWTRIGRNWQHPGQNTASVRRFDCPADGAITIAGVVRKLHLAGDGVRVMIRHNDRELWRAQLEGDDGQGVDPKLTLNVRKGDAIRFIVHKRGSINCDTTGWDPIVTYADGARHQASAGFEAHRQGESGWRYEMETDRQHTTGQPVARILRANGSWSRRPITADGPITLTDRDGVLPIVIVSDATDAQGLAVALSATSGWTLRVSMNAAGAVQVVAWGPGEAWAQSYSGLWFNGAAAVDGGMTADAKYADLAKRVRLAIGDEVEELALWTMIVDDWQRQDAIDDADAASYVHAIDRQIAQAWALLDDLRSEGGAAFGVNDARSLDALAARKRDAATARAQWLMIRRVKRRIAMSNPLMDFGPMLVCKRVPPSWSHEVAQYFGWRQRPGGGVFVIERPGRSLAARSVIGDQLPAGSVLEPRLSYDGKRIVFAHVACSMRTPDPGELAVNELGADDRYFHLYQINVDGTGLSQLTDGRYDDMMAEYLPDGRIAFCSSRRKGYSRCFGPEYSSRWHTYTLHRMNGDGSNIRTLSFNDVSEWFPAVSNDGHLIFARWDYVDRDAVTHQNLWSMRPDGTNPAAVWGNAAPKPHCTFQAKPIPGSNQFVFIASAHHAITGGPICLVNPTIDGSSLAAITRLTPQAFPEAEGGIEEWYAAPWPLSERYFLTAYSPYRLRFQGEHMRNPNPDYALGVYLIDAAGNRELLYRDPVIGTTNPTPLRARPIPPVLADTALTDAAESESTGRLFVSDIYHGLDGIARGTITQLRIVQVLPKTTVVANSPRIGYAGEENGRAVLGTVPVEPDGSAYFELPARYPVYFQALDDDGYVRRTMRSSTSVQPGETTGCIGCHEHRMMAPPTSSATALRRAPSRIAAGQFDGRPFSFVEVVQPVLEAHCVSCHGADKTEGDIDLTATPDRGFTRSYRALCEAPGLVPRYPQRNQIQVSPPDDIRSARRSRLIRMLTEGDGHQGVKLPPADLRRLSMWIDLNAIFYGVYNPDQQARQLRGEPVPMPTDQ